MKGRVIARLGRGLLWVYPHEVERSIVGAYSYGVMGRSDLVREEDARELERCSLPALQARLAAWVAAGVRVWPASEPRGTPKPAHAAAEDGGDPWPPAVMS